jgi:hypothetical protein
LSAFPFLGSVLRVLRRGADVKTELNKPSRGDLQLFGILIVMFIGLKITMGEIFFQIKKYIRR